MKEVKEEDIVKLYNEASDEVRQALTSLYGKSLFEERLPTTWKEVLNTFKTTDDELFKGYDEEDTKYKKVRLIFKALNQGWKPNWKDEDQPKYQIFWNINTNSYYDWYDYLSYSFVPASLCLKSSELCEHVEKYFSKEYGEYMLIIQQHIS